jgi:hypothetical protein
MNHDSLGMKLSFNVLLLHARIARGRKSQYLVKGQALLINNGIITLSLVHNSGITRIAWFSTNFGGNEFIGNALP